MYCMEYTGGKQMRMRRWAAMLLAILLLTGTAGAETTGQETTETKPGYTETKPAEGQSAEAKPAEGQPAEAKPAEGQPAETKPAEGQPAETKPAEGQPAEAKPAEGQPAETKPAEGQSAETKPAEGQPAEAKPAEGQPAEAKPAEGQPAEAKPVEGQPAEAKPAEGQPAEAKPAEGQSAEAKPEASAEPTTPAQTFPLPVAAGTRVKKTGKAVIDYSNVQDGYVMAQFTAKTDKRLKAQVKGPKTTYTYNVTPGKWEVFPLSDGNGTYQVVVYENVISTKYAAVTSVSFTATLKDEFAPYLRPNQYVDYAAETATLAKAKELIGTETDILKKVNKVYAFVVSNLTYDRQKAATVQSGYLPVLDSVLAAKKGICFDYAALMTGMLRSQGVPCKLVVGYAGTAYHAWISVWSEATGWVDAAIYFNGTTWHRMDPTFASSANKSDSIMKYIGDGANYTVKYLY